MKNKIINWTFGSIFRRIGSFIAYFIIGLIIALFFVKKDYVKASTYNNVWLGDLHDSYGTWTYWSESALYSISNFNTNTWYNRNITFDNGYNVYGGDIILNGFIKPGNNFDYEDSFICTSVETSTQNCIKWETNNSSSIQLQLWVINMSNPCTIEWNMPKEYSANNKTLFFTATCHTEVNRLDNMQIRMLIQNKNNSSQTATIGINRNMKMERTTENAIDSQTQQQQQQHNETINTLTNDTTYDENETSNIFEEFEDFLPDEGIVTQLVTLPISLYTNILNSVNGTCSPFSLGSLLGTNLTLPCINVANYLGSQLWSVIDILMSGFFILTIGRKFIKVFENMSSMKEGDVLSD